MTVSTQRNPPGTANELLISGFELTSGLGCDAIVTTTSGAVYLPFPQAMTISQLTNLSTKFYSTGNQVDLSFTFSVPFNNPVTFYFIRPAIPNSWDETGNLLSTATYVEGFYGDTYSPAEFLTVYANVIITSGVLTAYGANTKIDNTRFNYILLDYDDCDNDNVIDYMDCDPTDPQNQKIKICHNGNTICVNLNAVQSHLNHGDYLGSCISASRGVFTHEEKTKPGTQENAKPGIHVYPNPATTQITLKSSDDKMQGTVTIYDALGNKVYEKFFGNNKAVIDVKTLPSGVYYLRSDQMGKAIKFVKQ